VIPDPKQLKKAVLAFQKMGEKTVCIQAKLNFYNPHQNLLTRAFTAEYSLWFDLVLTGLQSINAPIPLGGTSNHFRLKDIRHLKGWDSFNVTEDCDLGIRIAKKGLKTALLDSTTLEEANSGKRNWLWQRSRWIKGYMQTYLVHMRNPIEFMKNWRTPHLITFQLVVGGKVLSMFINPLMWAITISYFALRMIVGSFIESFFPGIILYMGIFSLLVGNFLYAYYYMIGCAKHGHHELVKYVFLVPFYWLGMSVAAWIALYKLIVAPHHWSKTKHGLHLEKSRTRTRKLLRIPSLSFTPATLTYFDVTAV
jgi:cellulose synthase/poly-beta-1,6-N-acetylglucosamine synthase-like glycosyltransferase